MYKTNILKLKKINIIYLLTAIALFLLILYFFILINTTIITYEAKSFNNKLNLLQSDLNKVEQEYLSINNKIDINLAYEMGLEENLKNTVFVSKSNSVAAFLLDK